MPRLLELFAGTGSMGRAFRDLGWEVISLDITPGHTIQSDIMDWDYRAAYPPSFFHAVHASPPCTQYSCARRRAKTPRDLEGSDKSVQRTFDIIAFFRPQVWIIENPLTSLLKSRPVMEGLRHKLRSITYCRYGAPYRKSTAIWSNLDEHWQPRRMCTRWNPCEQVVDGSHPHTAQQGPGKMRGARTATANDRFSLSQLYAIPRGLCDELATASSAAIASDA